MQGKGNCLVNYCVYWRWGWQATHPIPSHPISSHHQFTMECRPEVGIGASNPQRMLFGSATTKCVSGIGARPGLVSNPVGQNIVVPAENLGPWTLLAPP